MVAGGDYYSRDVYTSSSSSSASASADSYSASASASYSAASAAALKQKSLHKSCDPRRFAEEKLECDHKNPIVFALDVTGSMGDWSKIIYDKMPMFYGQIMMQGYLSDPSISFCAVGDHTCDSAPLQITNFCQGKALDETLSKVWLEGGGGAGHIESYELSAYFYLNHSTLINNELPFFFLTGDENYYSSISEKSIKSIGMPVPKGMNKTSTISAKQVWKDLQAKYNVFMLIKPYNDANASKEINAQWKGTLGEEHLLHMKTPKACIDVILGAISLVSESRTLDSYIEDMKERGQESDRIAEVTAALTPLWNAIKSQTFKRVKHAVGSASASADEKKTPLEQARLLYSKNAAVGSSSSGDAAAPADYKCPITQAIMDEPVIVEDGHTYEKAAIEAWVKVNPISPLTGAKLENTAVFIPNNALKSVIADWKAKNKSA